jgi:hypothetical protein
LAICDLCKQEKEEVFKPTFEIIYSKDKDKSEVKFCKECMDFMTEEDGE